MSSAGSITAVVTKIFGNDVTMLLAALVCAVSGVVSLIVAIYYHEDDIASMFSGASEYFALREKVYRLVIQPNITEKWERTTFRQ